MATRVHLADDHTMFRQGLEAILASREGIEVLGSTSTGPEAEERIRRTMPDVVVTQLDMELKEAQGILAGIREASPDSRIVVLTLCDNLRYVRAISKMGIDAYLHKASSAEELIATLDLLGRNPGGQNAVVTLPRTLLQRLDEEPAGGLSERETELLVLAAHGLSNRRIAEQMHIAEATVKRHLANVYEKMGVSSRTEAVRRALMEQWIGIHEITSSAQANGNGFSSGGWDGTERRSGLDRRKGSDRRVGSDRRNGTRAHLPGGG